MFKNYGFKTKLVLKLFIYKDLKEFKISILCIIYEEYLIKLL